MSTPIDTPMVIASALFLSSVTRPNQRFPVPLEDLVIRYTATEVLSPVEPSDELIQWEATLELQMYDERDDIVEPVVVATAIFYSYDLVDSSSGPHDVLDSLTADTATFLTLFDPEGNLLEEIDPHGGRTRLIIADRVTVDPDMRGHRYGPFLAAHALRRIASDGALAVCYPAPFELPVDHPHRENQRARLCRIWERVGFRHFRDGIYVCDPELGDLDRATLQLRRLVVD